MRTAGQLSSRQKDIIVLVSHGQSNEEIAERMGLSLRTAKKEITHACSVLFAHNRAHLAAIAIRKGIIR